MAHFLIKIECSTAIDQTGIGVVGDPIHAIVALAFEQNFQHRFSAMQRHFAEIGHAAKNLEPVTG